MEYTKDVVFNVHYGQAMKLRERKYIKKLIKIYNSNKFMGRKKWRIKIW